MPHRTMKILAVEDDPRTGEALRQGLTDEGWVAEVTTRGDVAIQQIISNTYDAVVMDIMLPGCDGLEAVRQLRARNNSTPVLLLSARGEVDQRISGLNAGADDYLAKPFSMAEVIARLRAITRRAGEAPSQLLRVADLTLDQARRRAHRGERVIDLSPREYRLLEVLMQNEDNVCTRSLLLRLVWDFSFDPGTNLVDVYIRKLRDKVDDRREPPLLHTVRGVGYYIGAKKE